MKKKPVTLAGGQVKDYWSYDALQTRVSGLYRAAGLLDSSSHTSRRTAANRLFHKNYEPQTIPHPLCHAHLDQTDAYLPVKPEVLAAIFESAI